MLVITRGYHISRIMSVRFSSLLLFVGFISYPLLVGYTHFGWSAAPDNPQRKELKHLNPHWPEAIDVTCASCAVNVVNAQSMKLVDFGAPGSFMRYVQYHWILSNIVNVEIESDVNDVNAIS